MFFVYMLRCADGTLYTGYARDLDSRTKAHNAGRGAKYTAQRLPVSLVYWETCATRGAALKREYEIKQLARVEKEKLAKYMRIFDPNRDQMKDPAKTQPRHILKIPAMDHQLK